GVCGGDVAELFPPMSYGSIPETDSTTRQNSARLDFLSLHRLQRSTGPALVIILSRRNFHKCKHNRRYWPSARPREPSATVYSKSPSRLIASRFTASHTRLRLREWSKRSERAWDCTELI